MTDKNDLANATRLMTTAMLIALSASSAFLIVLTLCSLTIFSGPTGIDLIASHEDPQFRAWYVVPDRDGLGYQVIRHPEEETGGIDYDIWKESEVEIVVSVSHSRYLAGPATATDSWAITYTAQPIIDDFPEYYREDEIRARVIADVAVEFGIPTRDLSAALDACEGADCLMAIRQGNISLAPWGIQWILLFICMSAVVTTYLRFSTVLQQNSRAAAN